MMKYLILFCLTVVVYSNKPSLPHGHELHVMVDEGFKHIDSNMDGNVTLPEFDALVHVDPTNNSTCVDLDDFKMNNPYYIHPIADMIFGDFERNNDNCVDMSEISMEFFKIDKDGNGVLNLHEYEHYFSQVIIHLHGHIH